MKKEFTEEEVYRIEQDFKNLAHKQYEDSRRLFFRIVLIVLGILFAGFLLGLFVSK
jgi:hypothetical protein